MQHHTCRKQCLTLLSYGQCEKKEEYIERIQTLDFDTKAAIAVHIQEVATHLLVFTFTVCGQRCKPDNTPSCLSAHSQPGEHLGPAVVGLQ